MSRQRGNEVSACVSIWVSCLPKERAQKKHTHIHKQTHGQRERRTMPLSLRVARVSEGSSREREWHAWGTAQLGECAQHTGTQSGRGHVVVVARSHLVCVRVLRALQVMALALLWALSLTHTVVWVSRFLLRRRTATDREKERTTLGRRDRALLIRYECTA